VEDGLQSRVLTAFSAGAVSATLLFLTAVAGLGTVLRSFIPPTVSAALNVAVGLLIAGFGVKMILKKK
jgi:threonine/homoserine/homoserine lactone efflux protein